MPGTFSHGYALLIGVGECANPNWSLPVTVKDMQALRSVLIDPAMCGYPNDDAHILLLHDSGATREGILEGLKWLAKQTATDDEATAIVFYSGHGGRKESTDSYFLLPSDTDPKKVESSTIDGKKFTEALRSVKAKRLLVFMDCCHAGGMATAKHEPVSMLPPEYSLEPMPKGLIEELKQGEGRAVFSSSKNEQTSWIRRDGKMSIYTYHLIEALYGAGNRPNDTTVRLSNLMDHLDKSVPKSVRKEWDNEQTPFFDTATENFPVAMLCGGKGLPSEGFVEEKAAQRIHSLLSGINQSGSDQTFASIPSSAISPENPFTPLNVGIDDPSLVFGRESKVNQALELLRTGSSVVFLGDHGSGRSSLLTLLLDRVSKDLGWKTARLDLLLVDDEKSFYRELCKELGVAEAKGYRLKRALNGKRFLLALDEVERMKCKGFTRNLRDQLRGLAGDASAPLKLAMAASIPLDRLFTDSLDGGSPLAGICQQIEVGPWDFNTARQFLLARLKNTSVTFSESEMEQIFKASAGMPLLLMNQAYHLYRRKTGQAP